MRKDKQGSVYPRIRIGTKHTANADQNGIPKTLVASSDTIHEMAGI
jgi:hypothetical protein